MQTIRTTIRIRKDLLDQSRLVALRRETSLQEIINDTLAQGFGHITDFDVHKEAMARIDKFRGLKNRKFNVKKMVEENKKELEDRSSRILNLK
ncbi:hypothetical protein A3C26_01915 [Candidatus Daviesbacteria bacterium RIFCSPHIGHO2_02_FULL_39_12]|uniref:Uncharacterized protein n=2 Tax=Candidatus Daviesiibacteriota TaxID=1752718 RepID=A0A1F5JB40_9BACT|nr:MAG: hypothetical protein A3C26_01915 [Candidatus Daviesbacteria bacterium RIFCSPHIGHO2_02_FULL_39_12]OGE71471.1 MAG: hypothetical protein A3H40_03010 [Candidatus Daviesbacteria bacterium RIFCSPLOWO2_02_FULL_38_15]